MTGQSESPNEYSRWLQDVLDRLEITSYRLAIRSGVPQPTVTRILTGETKNPKAETLRALSEAAGGPPPLEKESSEDISFRLEASLRLAEIRGHSLQEAAHEVNAAVAILRQGAREGEE